MQGNKACVHSASLPHPPHTAPPPSCFNYCRCTHAGPDYFPTHISHDTLPTRHLEQRAYAARAGAVQVQGHAYTCIHVYMYIQLNIYTAHTCLVVRFACQTYTRSSLLLARAHFEKSCSGFYVNKPVARGILLKCALCSGACGTTDEQHANDVSLHGKSL